jgi:hypothetical protein
MYVVLANGKEFCRWQTSTQKSFLTMEKKMIKKNKSLNAPPPPRKYR